MNRRQFGWWRPAWLAAAAMAGFLVIGCGPANPPSYTARTSIKGEAVEIPARHREQIAGFLDEYFGRPLSPRAMRPAASDAAPASADAADQAAESAAKPKIPLVDTVDRQVLRHGAELYRQQCAGCHGITGDGQGPAAQFLNPPPRDYRLGRFKFASTPRGVKPRHEDLERVIRRGAKGTSMPAFRWMADDDLAAVIEYVKLLSNRGELELKLIYESQQVLDETEDYDPETVAQYLTGILASWDAAKSQVILPLTVRPAYDEASIRLGAEAFVRLECIKCHGKDGRGNKKFNVGPDDWGRVAFAADLTSGLLHGGRRPVDIYRRIYSGINATPMPAFATPNEAQGETAQQRSETIWHLVHFVTSIVEGKPVPMDVIDQTIKSLPAPPATDPPPGETPAGAAPGATGDATRTPAQEGQT